MIWSESGGSGARTVLLLHGVGATAAVWLAVKRALQERGTVRWIAADLSGHGGSHWRPFYSVGELAAGIAEVVHEAPELFIVGHSLGAYVGLALASGWFGIQVRGVVGLGPKVSWPPADLDAARELSVRPMRWYPTEDEARGRYRRVAGLGTDIAPGEAMLERGVVRGPEGWRLAQDPLTFAVAGAPFATLAASAVARVRLARGERDPMVSIEALRRHGPAWDIAGAGHNAHVEDPGAVLALLDQLAAEVRAA